MKANTFIVKRVYIERNAEREYKQHQKRLERIKSQPQQGVLTRKVSQVDDLLLRSKENHVRAKEFRDVEKLREEKVTNKALINKLLEINDGRYSIGRISVSEVQTTKAGATGTATSKEQKVIDPLQQPSKSFFGGSLNSISRKFEEARIQKENQSLAQRMIQLPPVIQKKRLDEEYERKRELKERIQRFHVLKDKPDYKYQRITAEDDDGLDESDEQLMNQRVHIVVSLKDIQFLNFLPQNDENEKYFLEIQASTKGMRRTQPEQYDDFAKSIINEFFFLHELKKSKVLYVGLHQLKRGVERFLGDFELDLSPYFKEESYHTIHFDLRNYKELRNMPNYMHKDMRKKGTIDFTLKIRSSVKNYLMDTKKISHDLNQNEVIEKPLPEAEVKAPQTNEMGTTME